MTVPSAGRPKGYGPGPLASLGGWFAAVAIAVAILLTACAAIRPAISPAASGPATGATGAAAIHPPPVLAGQVDFGAARAIQATMGEVANGASVSFIDGTSGHTVATALASSTGSFQITFPLGFAPATDATYLLEAIKGLGSNAPSNNLARVRTVVGWTGNGWTSLTNATPGNVKLDSGTSAIAIGAALLSLPYAPFIGSLAIGQQEVYSPPAGSPLTVSHFDTLVGLVKSTLAADQDPVATIGFDAASSAFVRVNASLAISSQSAVRVAVGDSLTITGVGFDPTIANDSVTFGMAPGTITSASATQIVVTVPAGAVTGPVRLRVDGLSVLGPTVGVVTGAVTTLTGGVFLDGDGLTAKFNQPYGMAVDASGTIYVADSRNHRIRTITAAGVVSTLAGSGMAGFADGTGTAAQFSSPRGVAVDGAGTVYVADRDNNRIRKVTAAGVVSTLAGSGTAGFADGTGTAAQFYWPSDVAVDGAGTVYVADSHNHRIRMVTAGGVVNTLAGSGTNGYADGTGTAAQFYNPSGVAVGDDGTVYVADSNNHRIRKVTAAGVVSTLAGSGTYGYADGTGTAAQFYSPTGVEVDSAGTAYVADYSNHRIRKITAAGVVSTLAGGGTGGYVDGTGTAARFYFPRDVAVDDAGTVCVADFGNNRIRKVTAAGVVSTLAGSGTTGFADATGTAARFNSPRGVAVDGAGTVYVADRDNNRIRKVTAAGVVSTLAGSGTAGFADGTGAGAQFNYPTGVAVDGDGTVYVADQSNNRIRKVSAAGVVSTMAGSGTAGFADGTGTAAQFNNPFGLAVDAAGTVYVADQSNNRIRKVTAAGVVSTVAGNATAGYADGTGAAAQFDNPTGIAVDGTGTMFVADGNNNRIRKVTPAGVVSTLAGGTQGFADGTGPAARFKNPFGVAVDGAGMVYVADYNNYRIRLVTPTGVATTLAGSGITGQADGEGTTALFNYPQGVAVGLTGTVYVADKDNHAVRLIR